MGAADGQRQQDGVQPHEGGGGGGRAPGPARGGGGQPHGQQAGERREDFERPQPAGQAERRDGVAGEREEGAVGGVLQRPADEREGGVGGCLRGDVGVGVQAVQSPHAGVVQVAEDVLGDERGSQRGRDVGQHDPAREQRGGQARGAGQRQRVAGAGGEHEDLEAARAQVRAGAGQRTGQPAGPAAAVGGHVARGRSGGVDGQQEQGGDDQQQARRSECDAHLAGQSPARSGSAARPPCRDRLSRLHGPILPTAGPAGVHDCR